MEARRVYLLKCEDRIVGSSSSSSRRDRGLVRYSAEACQEEDTPR